MAAYVLQTKTGLRPEVLGHIFGADYSPSPSGFLSVNVFRDHQVHKNGVTLCKTNCRNIEVPLLYPLDFEDQEDFEQNKEREREMDISGTTLERIAADQEPISPIANDLSRVTSTPSHPSTTPPFPFLRLPLELRLKIYALLLPPRHHKIVTQLPHNGYFYNTASIPAYSTQSFYPFGTKAPSQAPNNLTTYKVLSTNFSAGYPSSSIHPDILGTSRQAKDEAETVLYGNPETIWDFGVHLDACRAFWGDRGGNARKVVRGLRAAWEVPVRRISENGMQGKLIDEKWVAFCEWLSEEMTGLRTLDLTVLGSSGSMAVFPSVLTAVPDDEDESVGDDDWQEREIEMMSKKEVESKWREWEWIHDLLQMGALKTAKITLVGL